jgi:hypothetical protein
MQPATKETGEAMEHDVSASKPIRTPGPDHPITIERNPNRVLVLLAGRVVAVQFLSRLKRRAPKAIHASDVPRRARLNPLEYRLLAT